MPPRRGCELFWSWVSTNMPRLTALGSAGFSPLQCANWCGRWKISARAAGRAVKRRERRAPGPGAWWPVAWWPCASTGQRQFGLDERGNVELNLCVCFVCHEKRWRATALQNAGALADDHRMREASWSAPALWRFGRVG